MENNVRTFVENIYEKAFANTLDRNSTYYCEIEELPEYEDKGSLYVVVGYCEDVKEWNLKIAYNCDDLQCDFDWDWMMPDFGEDVIDTELYDILQFTLTDVLIHIDDCTDELKNLML